MKKIIWTASAVAFVASPIAAQEAVAVPAQAPQPVVVQAVAAAPVPATVLPAGTEIPVKMAETVTTKGNGWHEGDQFTLTVAAPVKLGQYVVIPEGTKGTGRIKWLTSRGAFGKSGKMDIELEYLELAGQRIDINGTYRQEGDGATLATVGGVILAGVFAGFITGKSGVIPQGRELKATLASDLPVALPEGASLAPKMIQASDPNAAPAPAPATTSTRPPAVLHVGG